MRTLWLIVIVSGLLAACAPATRLIAAPTAKQAVVAPSDSALLVVSNVMRWPVLNLLDDKGEVVGQLTTRSFTTIRRPAGPFRMYVVPENKGVWGDRVDGTLEAGKVYYIQVAMRWGGASMEVVAQRLDPGEWANRRDNEKNLDQVALDPANVGQLKQDLGDVGALIKDVDGVYDHLEAGDKAKRSVQAGDGEPR